MLNVLDLQPAVGAVERLYLDAKTYLPARLNTVRKLGVITAPVEVYYDDWKAVDGIQYPFSISQRFEKLTLSFTVKEIRQHQSELRGSRQVRAYKPIFPVPVAVLAAPFAALRRGFVQ